MASPNDRFARGVPQEKIPGQGKIQIPRVEVDRTRIQPYVNDINLGGTIIIPIPDCVPTPHKLNLDVRTRHLRFIHEGEATVVAIPPLLPPLLGDIFWTWGQPQLGSRGVLHPGDDILFDDLFFEYNTLYLEVTPLTAAHVLIYGW